MLPRIVTSVPGPKSRIFSRRLQLVESRNVTFIDKGCPIILERAAGVNVWDVDTNRFLDFSSAFGVTTLGHAHSCIRIALQRQASKLWHAMGDIHPSRTKVELCEALSSITFERWKVGRAKTILGSSGSESVEAAVKTALLYSGKAGVLSFIGGYHGLSLGALETIGIPGFRTPFKGQLGRFGVQVPYPGYRCPSWTQQDCHDYSNSSACLDSLEKEIKQVLATREIGCILVEPIQARGGVRVPPHSFLPLLRHICDTHKLLLILDEIYTGFNRTGCLFACEHSNVIPDIICLGKGLTNGFPFSACVGRSDVMDAWPSSKGEALHTSTFLGNPLGCAMALSSIKEHCRSKSQETFQQKGSILRRMLQSIHHSAIGEIRGSGLMFGVELIQSDGAPHATLASQVVRKALQDGLILLATSPASNVLLLTPSLRISEKEMYYTVMQIQEYLDSFPS